ncbi:hypothetical protein [Streptomyces thioluteus]
MIAKVDERLCATATWASSSARTRSSCSRRRVTTRSWCARPLRRTIQREIEDILSEKILFGELRPGHIVVVGTEGEGEEKKFTFRGEEKTALPDTPPVEQAAGGAGPNLSRTRERRQ